VVAVRPLRVEELAEVLAVDFEVGGTPMLNPGWRWSDHQEAVLSACSGLVTIIKDGDSRIVQFSHFSVKEYLTSDRLAESSRDVSRYHIQLATAHTILAQACLGVLLRLDDDVDQNSINSFPLARYAAQYWVTHVQFGNVSSRIEDGMDCLFDQEKPYFATWLWIYNEDRPGAFEGHSPRTHPSDHEGVPLYHAALRGFRGLVERLLAKHPEDVTTMRGRDGTPLYAAARRQHLEVFSLLVDHFPDVDLQNGYGYTALHLAAWRGYLEVGRRLLNRGADVNARSDNSWTPLCVAALWGQSEFARMLLDHGALINAQADDGGTPLHRASQEGYVETVKVLLDKGADVNARDKKGKTPSNLASDNHQRDVVQLLLEYLTDSVMD
jgi:ankyrin repeat protein